MATTSSGSVLRPVDDADLEASPVPTEPKNSVRSAGLVALGGYAVLTVLLLGVGLLLTHPLSGSIGRWDEHVNEYFARNRTVGWNDLTKVATACFNTVPVVLGATLVVALLAWRRRWDEAAFLVLALVLEITVFLSVTFVVARPRPDVARLNSTPSTSSFPSGHTAAATVLFVGIAIIVMSCTANRFARVSSTLVALAVATLVGFARVYRGLHHPTDVIIGALLGLACLLVAGIAIRAAVRPARSERMLERLDGGLDRALEH